MLWINFIHLYQPANSSSARIKEAVEKSYYRLTRLLEENKDLYFTANISACLLERLQEDGFTDLINRWRQLIITGRLELLGSAAYHGFLPFLPEKEVQYQIQKQEEIIADILKVDVRGQGFFLPEMAYTPKLAKLIKKIGYSWIILDEASLPEKLMVPEKSIYTDKNSDLKVLVRQREFSNAYAPDLINKLSDKNELPNIMVTATDAELYGLRHEDPTAELEKMVVNPTLETMTISRFIERAEASPVVDFRAASWETNQALDKKYPFLIWHHPKNKVQTALWDLSYLAIEAGDKYFNDQNYNWYRWHLNRGLASCAFWWASGRDFFHNFGPRAWSPDEVETGLNDLLRAIRSLQDKASYQDKIKAEKLAAKIRLELWREHWQHHWLTADKDLLKK